LLDGNKLAYQIEFSFKLLEVIFDSLLSMVQKYFGINMLLQLKNQGLPGSGLPSIELMGKLTFAWLSSQAYFLCFVIVSYSFSVAVVCR